MKAIIATILLSVTSNVWARDVKFQKKVDLGTLQAQLRTAGFTVNYIDCSGDNCTIHMPDSEKKDPMPIVKKYVYVDPMAARKKKMDDMRALYAKWDAGTITPAEKDTLLKMLAQLVLRIDK